MRRYLLVALVAATACRRTEEPTPQPRQPPQVRDAAPTPDAAEKPSPYRTDKSGYGVDPKLVGTGKTSLVSSEEHIASERGEKMLAAGGNAVDAAVTTALVLAVTHPSAGNLAGGGFAVVRISKGKAAALDFRETAPGAATANMYLDDAGNPTKASMFGDRAVGVPGSVAGLYELHKKYGKKKWAEVVAPAIELATNGFAIEAHLHESLTELAVRRGEIKTAPTWFPEGKPVALGAVVKNPELAATLKLISDKGPDGFYKGVTAKAIVDEMKRGNGIITAADLAGYKAVWRDALHTEYRGKQLYTMPPPSSGGVVITMIANMLHDKDLGKWPWHGFDHVHNVVEVFRRGYAARNEVLGDPKFVKNPIAKLLSPEYTAELVKTITDKATPSKEVAGLIDGKHTTNLCVVDKDGMAVAITTTLNLGFGTGVEVNGFLLNDEMDDFTSKPGTPNAFGLVQGVANKIEPGKRMLSSMSPTVIEDEKGELLMVVGGQGGSHIITEVWQTISNVIDFHMTVDQAVAAPRFHHQHLPDEVLVDDDSITEQTAKQLEAAGYKLALGHPGGVYGSVTAIVRTKDGWQGSVDPRNGGAAVGD
ncbi:MAG TPA: gamma-glutamyltransferase [Kofleriaceae bacterium]